MDSEKSKNIRDYSSVLYLLHDLGQPTSVITCFLSKMRTLNWMSISQICVLCKIPLQDSNRKTVREAGMAQYENIYKHFRNMFNQVEQVCFPKDLSEL